MWDEIRRYPAATLARHGPEYRRWLRPRLRSKEVLAWIVEGRDGAVAASGALWFQPSLPRPGMPQRTSPYVFTMYTERAARGHGLATRIVREMIRESRLRGFPRVLLHASTQGRAVYRRIGFERTWEMRYWIDRRAAQVPRRRAPRRPRRPAP